MTERWRVKFSAKAAKQGRKLAKRELDALIALLEDLKAKGPILPDWPNYSKLGDGRYHCHLSYKWVACWTIEDNELKLLEIYYVGSRENAPY